MNISIFGLGYVGTVALACLSSLGHKLIGVDVNESKVDYLREGKSLIIEHGLSELIYEQHKKGLISATTDPSQAIKETELSFICVGTPSSNQGHLSLKSVFDVAGQIGQSLSSKNGFHVVAIRSTVSPGTYQRLIDIIAEKSGKKDGEGFAVVCNPEFLREGSAIDDFMKPPYTLLASTSDKAIKMMRDVYAAIPAQIIVTSVSVAEMVKYVNNAFHAVKIAFANEIGNICKRLCVDSHELMRIFCCDTKLNISSCYLTPGFAFGGSCLPKDLKALSTIAHDLYLESPLLDSVFISNENQKALVIDQILSFGKQRVGFLGLSFKSGTDDLRSSPIIDILERLLGKGYDLLIYDKNVRLSQLLGTNREFIYQRIPFISRFIVDDAKSLIERSEVVVIVNNEVEFAEIVAQKKDDIIVYDLVNIYKSMSRQTLTNYIGHAW